LSGLSATPMEATAEKVLGGRSAKIALVIFAVAFAFFLLRGYTFLSNTQASHSPATVAASVPVTAAAYDNNLRLSGTTQAARSFVVLAPQLEGAQLSNMVITSLIPGGAQVKPNDLLVAFDPQAQMKDYLEKQNKYTELAGQVAQKQADEEIARAKDETALEQAENDYKKAQLELQKNEIVSRIDAEKNQETLDETQTTWKQLQETFELKRKAAAAAIRILELQRDRAQQAMQYAQSNASKMTIYSPMEGVAVRNSIWLNGRMGTVQVGDQVNPGTSFMQVVDPSKMEVRVAVNQSDVEKIHIGDHAQIRPDAYPGMSVPAVLEEISPLGQEGSFSDKIRFFTARFSVQGSDPRLLPDLSVAVDIDLANRNARDTDAPAARH
jgi:HlyD family secretion protein